MFIILIQHLLYYTYCTCPLARPSTNNEYLPKLFYCTCVITDTCFCTCRFVSTILNTLTQMYMYIYPHTHTHTHTHAHTTICTQDRFFPLFSASQEGHDRIVEMLLQAGTTVNLQDKVGNYYYLCICHLWCAMCSIHCTLSTTQQSGEYEGQRTYPTHSHW